MNYIGFLIKKCSIMSINAHYWAFKQIIIKPWSFYRIMGRFIIEVNVSCLVSLMLTLTWGVNILFEKLTPEVGVSIWKKTKLGTLCLWGCGFHAKPIFFLNIFYGDLHFDAFILGSVKFVLLLVRILEKVQFKMCLLVYWWRCG